MKIFRRNALAALCASACLSLALPAFAQQSGGQPTGEDAAGKVELTQVATFDHQVTGVTVTEDGFECAQCSELVFPARRFVSMFLPLEGK